MRNTGSNARKFVIAFGLGAVGGVFLIAWAAKAMPKMMSRMMQNMVAHMQEEGCDPTEM